VRKAKDAVRGASNDWFAVEALRQAMVWVIVGIEDKGDAKV